MMSVLDVQHPAGAEDRFDQSWLSQLDACRESIPTMSNAELAKALRWANKNSCYYMSEMCDLLDAAVEESAKRLIGEVK
jgi:hypothetical protein